MQIEVFKNCRKKYQSKNKQKNISKQKNIKISKYQKNNNKIIIKISSNTFLHFQDLNSSNFKKRELDEREEEISPNKRKLNIEIEQQNKEIDEQSEDQEETNIGTNENYKQKTDKEQIYQSKGEDSSVPTTSSHCQTLQTNLILDETESK